MNAWAFPESTLQTPPQDKVSNNAKVTVIAIILTVIFCVCWGPDKIFSLLLLLHPRRMHTPLLIASDVMMCLAYCQPSFTALLLLVSRIDDRITVQEVKTDQSNVVVKPSCRPRPTEGAKDDAVEPMMISTV